MTYQVADPGDNYVDEHGALLVTNYVTDSVTSIPVVMDYNHYKIHEGEIYTTSYYWTALADAGSAMMHGSIPAGFEPHGEFAVNIGGNCKFEIVEGGTLTGGTALDAFNRNRNAAVLSVGTIAYHSGTIAGGSVIYTAYEPGGEKNFATGNGSREESEWIFKEGVLTTFRATNISGGAINLSMNCTFYNGA